MINYLVATTPGTYQPRFETFNGESHIVVPVTLLTEGVHNGSAGPIYYPAEEISAHAWAWDGEPVPIRHPEIDGELVSANSPSVLDEWNVGRIFHARYNSAKKALQGEAYLNVRLMEERNPALLADLRAGKSVEVSTGLSFDVDGENGTWQGEAYLFTARNLRPDHLALLPDQVGACSLEDGCGIRANRQEEQHMVSPKFFRPESKGVTYQGAIRLGVLATSMEDQGHALQRLADGMDRTDPNGERVVHWIEASFSNPNKVIIRQVRRTPDGAQPFRREEKFFEAAFEVDDNGLPTQINTDFTEVRERREFIPVTMAESLVNGDVTEENTTKVNLEEGLPKQTINSQSSSEETMKKEQLVQSLIDNKTTQWTPCDQSALMEMGEETLAKMVPITAGDTSSISNIGDIDGTAGNLKSTDDEDAIASRNAKETLDALPDGPGKTALRGAYDAQLCRRNKLITDLTGNTDLGLEKVTLEAMDDVALEALHKLHEKSTGATDNQRQFTAFSGRAAPVDVTASNVTPLPLPRTKKATG
jgi:hypothetical protein